MSNGNAAICGEHSEAIRNNAEAIGELTIQTDKLKEGIQDLKNIVNTQVNTMKTIKKIGYLVLGAIIIEIGLRYASKYI